MNKILKVVIQVLILILLIWAIIYFVDIRKAYINVSNADPKWVSAIIIISVLSHLCRAYRWKLMLQPLSYNPSLWHTFISVMTGYFVNIFNMRGGEALRSVVLLRSDKIPFTSSFATVMAERVFDLLCLIVLIFFTLSVEFDRFYSFIQKEFLEKMVKYQNLLLAAIAVCIIIAVVLFVLRNKIKVVKKIYDYIISLFVQAINSFRLLDKKREFLIFTVLIWVGYYFTVYLAFFALPFPNNLDVWAGFVLLVLGAMAVSIPIPGNLGYIYIITAACISFYKLDLDEGKTLAVLLYGTQLFTLLIIGGACAVVSLFLGDRKQEKVVS